MKLLFVTGARVGDAVLSTGLLDHLLRQNPGAQVTIACGPAAAPIFEAVPGLERLLTIHKRRFSLHWLTLWLQTLKTSWDLVVDLRGSALAWLIPARQRRIWRSHGLSGHRVTHLGAILQLDPPPAPKIWIDDARRFRAAEMISQDVLTLALAPTANFRGKCWPSERFVTLALRLTAFDGPMPGARIAIFGGPDERDLAQPVIDALPADRVLDLVGAADLLTIAACLQRCSLFIGNDSGLMHLAAAGGVTTLGLFGPSPIERYSPWGTHTAVASTTIAYPRHWEMLKADPSFVDLMMDTLPVERVEQAARDLLARTAA
jgi:heptosyltransferase-3